MELDSNDYIGRDVHDRDDMKVGTVKRLIENGGYVVVDQPLSPDLVLPISELRRAGDRLIVERTRSYLDDAPEVDTKRTLSPEDRRRIDEFYLPRAA
jgi:hypothetical protein